MRRLTLATLIGILAATVVLLADYAHVETATPVTNDADPWNVTIDLTAGNASIWAWSTGETGSASCGSFATNQSDTEETLVEHRFSTAYRICIAVVCNSNGGSTTGTVTHGASGVAENFGVSEFSGVSDSACIEDTADGEASSVTTITTDAVTHAGAAFIYGYLGTNRNPAVAGAGSPSQRWEATGVVVGVTGNAQDKRASAGGTSTLQWDLDVSGVIAYGIIALTEDGGGAPASFIPGIINAPIRGGGLNYSLVNQGRPWQPARLVQTTRVVSR